MLCGRLNHHNNILAAADLEFTLNVIAGVHNK